MPTYIKTVSFQTSSKFNPKKDDPRVNAILEDLQSKGARIVDISVSLGGSTFTGVIATYVITYEGPARIS